METPTHNHIKIGRDLEIYIPKNLAACDSYEYSAMCQLLYNWQTSEINFEDLKVQAVYKLCRLKKGRRKLNQLEEEIMYANIYQLSTLIDSFFNQTQEGVIIAQDYVHNHNPKVRTLFASYHGPKDRFEDVTWGQYEDGLNLYNLFNVTKNKSFLYALFATFYIRKGQKYDKHKTENRTKVFDYVDFGTIYGFYLFFAAFQIYVTSSSILYEGNQIDLSILFKEIEKDNFKSDIPGLGMKSLSYHLAESSVYGDLDKVRSQDMWEVFLRLYDIRKRDLDALEREKLAKNKAS